MWTEMVLPMMLHFAKSWWYKQKRSGKKACGGLFRFPAARIFIPFPTQIKPVSKTKPRHHQKGFTHFFFPPPRKATQKRDWEFQRAALEPGIFIQRSTGKLRRSIPYLLLILLQEIVIKWRKGQIKGLWIIVPSPKETSGGIQQVPESGSDPGVRTAPHCGLVAHPSLWSYWALWNP